MVLFKIKIDEQELLRVIDEKLDEITTEIFANSQNNIVEKGIVDEGTLLKSGNVIREFLEKTIIYNALHAEPTEFGRLPGNMPPVDKIKAWVKRKGFAKDEKEVSKISWAIAIDIKKNGLEPRPFLGPAISAMENKLRSKT